MTDTAIERRVSEQVLIPQLSLQSMFWRPKFTDDSAWYPHVPVAFWLIEAHHPQRVVELGCDEPVAYFAFCQALERLNPLCESLAFTTQPPRRAWLDYNDAQYQEFSSLQQATEQQALQALDDGDVDLMHVSPSAAAAVLENWEAWERKLSPSGLVVISEAQGRTGSHHGAELYRYLKGYFPHFLFAQGAGLGIVAVGDQQSDVVSRLLAFSPRDPSARLIQQVFSRLGLACAPVSAGDSPAAGRPSAELAQAIAERDERIGELATLTQLLESAERREQQERQQREQVEQARARAAEERRLLERAHAELETQLKAVSAELAALKQGADKARADQQAEVKALKASLDQRSQEVAEQQAKRERAEARLTTLETELGKERAARQEVERAAAVEREQAEHRLTALRERADQLGAQNSYLQAEQAQRFDEIAQLTRMLEERPPEVHDEVKAEPDARQPQVAEAPVASGEARKPRLVERFVMRGKDARKLKRQAQLVQGSGLFDAEWYLATYSDVREAGMPPLEHFLRFGGQEGRSPGPNFDSHWYLTEYLDVAESGMNPLLHYLKFGRSEQRLPVPGGVR
ncbi:hypothetical protein MKP05_16395 [Halomonas sp. EGI 63088]|uniref:Chromosome partition protein Smc n=1 Tax=Halomonas flagellata TaxID=2920385 RepID=A0ABS9RXW3_9GAMM|nr:class I SAM-dependent methyltransferase [Halomonas flagellata]MCH4564682.1 hypothetical protein [Halomonas flagellata]